MAAPNVTLREIDLSTRVPAFPGVFGAMVIPALKGPIDTPFLVTSETEFLRKFTQNEKIPVGADLGHYAALNFLQKSNRLWIQRVHNGALHGGVKITQREGADVTTTQSEPFTFVAATDDQYTIDVDGAGLQTITFDAGSGILASTIVGSVNAVITTSAPVFAIENSDGTITFRANNSLIIDAATTSEVALGVTIGTTTSTTSAAIGTGEADPTSHTFTGSGDDIESFFVHALNPGAWNNDVGIKIFNNLNSPDRIKEPNAFIIEVWKREDNIWALAETPFEVTKVIGQKDGFGRNMYVEDALVTSEFIRIQDNVAVADTTQPKENTTILAFGAGDDGVAVVDAEMIIGLDGLKNPEEKPVTLMMDSGWATPAFGLEIIKLAEKRIGTLGILSTPFALEAASSFLNDLVDYRKLTLNVNTSWAAIYTPHPKIYDKFNDRNLFISPDGFVGAIIAATASNFEMWFPPAGFRRGIIQVLDLRRRFSRGQMDLLYDNNINPLRFAPGRGILVWGQKTLLARPSALDRVNVRLLLIVIEPAIMEALEDFIFELNDSATRSLIKSMIDSYMDGIKARRGVSDFQVVVDETNNLPTDIDNNILNVWLFVKPIKAVEFIKFAVIITREGMSFALAAEAL